MFLKTGNFFTFIFNNWKTIVTKFRLWFLIDILHDYSLNKNKLNLIHELCGYNKIFISSFVYKIHLVNVLQMSVALVANRFRYVFNDMVIATKKWSFYLLNRYPDAESPSRLVGAYRMRQLWPITIWSCINCKVVCVRVTKPQGWANLLFFLTR